MISAAMTPLVQGSTGLALALGFGLLPARRAATAATVCACQAAVVAAAALGRGEAVAAMAELAEAVALLWWGRGVLNTLPNRTGGLPRGLPVVLAGRFGDAALAGGPALGDGRILSERDCFGPGGVRNDSGNARRSGHDVGRPTALRQPARQPHNNAAILSAAALLALLGALVPGTGVPLAVILLGLLALAVDAPPLRQVLGLAAAQNGLVLTAIVAGLQGWRLAVVVLPWLPALAVAGLWLGSTRSRLNRLLAPSAAAAGEAALCILALLLACALPWHLDPVGPVWRLDARAAQIVLLLCALAAAASWGRRNESGAWGSRIATLAGAVAAVLAATPLLGWLGLVVATIGAIAAELPARSVSWQRLRLGSTGLALGLFGGIASSVVPTSVATVAAAAVGYGALAMLAPELAIAGAALILRLPSPPFLLLALGLAAWLIAAGGLAMTRFRQRHVLGLAGLGQMGVAVFAFGLGTPEGALAGLLQLTFLALTQSALLLARPGGLDQLAALAGLAGAPPFGLFPSLALVVAATAAATPWLLAPLGAGLALMAWPLLARLPTARRLTASPAWLPLALLLLCGFAMPAPWLAWFRLAAR